MDTPSQTGRRWALVIVAMTAAVLAVLSLSIFAASNAKAADKGGPSVFEDAQGPKASGWTGCHVGAFGSQVSGPSILGIGTTGQLAGVAVGCDVKLEKFVVGTEVSYAKAFGDMSSVSIMGGGIDTDLTVMGRIGYLVTPSLLPYAHADWVRLSGGGDHVDGYKYGVGLEFKLPERPVALDLRYSHGILNTDTPVDITTDEIRLGVKFRFAQ